MTQSTEATALTVDSSHAGPGRPRIHRAWFVAAVAFVTILGAAAFRSLPGLLIDPLHQEFGW